MIAQPVQGQGCAIRYARRLDGRWASGPLPDISIKHYSTSSASPYSPQPQHQHRHRHQHQHHRRHIENQHGCLYRHIGHHHQRRWYHKPFQRTQRKRLYQHQRAAMEARLQTPRRVTGRTASSSSSGHLLKLALENITIPRYTLLSLTLALCIATACICILSLD